MKTKDGLTVYDLDPQASECLNPLISGSHVSTVHHFQPIKSRVLAVVLS